MTLVMIYDQYPQHPDKVKVPYVVYQTLPNIGQLLMLEITLFALVGAFVLKYSPRRRLLHFAMAKPYL